MDTNNLRDTVFCNSLNNRSSTHSIFRESTLNRKPSQNSNIFNKKELKVDSVLLTIEFENLETKLSHAQNRIKALTSENDRITKKMRNYKEKLTEKEIIENLLRERVARLEQNMKKKYVVEVEDVPSCLSKSSKIKKKKPASKRSTSKTSKQAIGWDNIKRMTSKYAIKKKKPASRNRSPSIKTKSISRRSAKSSRSKSIGSIKKLKQKSKANSKSKQVILKK